MLKVPLIIVLTIAVVLAVGLYNKDGGPPPPERLVSQQVEPFTLPGMKDGEAFSPALWSGKVAFINAFASWCKPCQADHTALMTLAAAKKVPIYGVAWRDKKANVAAWLKTRGNPYDSVGLDPNGSATMALAMTGVPESFIVDKQGVVRFHFAGALTDEMVQKKILPLVETLHAQ